MTNQLRIIPEYQRVKSALTKLSALSGTSESHGLLCALFSGGAEIRLQAWIDSLMAEPVESGDVMAKQAFATLASLYQFTQQQFESDDLVLDMLLASDRAAFNDRINSLSAWVQGYISGLGLFSIEINSLSAEAQEALQDLLDISRLRVDEENPEEVDEKAFVELVEFIKVAVLLIHSERGYKKDK